MGEIVRLSAKDGFTLSAWRAKPHGKPRGSVVVVQEIFGLNAHIRSVTDGFAADGYFAIAPALFDRVKPGVEFGYDKEGMQEGRACVSALTLEQTLLDLSAAVDAASKAGKVGIVGYCWGGTLTWLASCRVPGLSAAAGYYGSGIVKAANETPKVPTILHFGARDASIPPRDVEAIEAAHPSVTVYVYNADHGFNCDVRASYDEAAAKLARRRTLDLFATHLGGS